MHSVACIGRVFLCVSHFLLAVSPLRSASDVLLINTSYLYFIFIGYLFCMRFSRYVTGLQIFLRPMGLSGLEPPTSRLSGVRSNQLSYKPLHTGNHLLSHTVSSAVPSAAWVLTIVFGMGTGVSPRRIITSKYESLMTQQ